MKRPSHRRTDPNRRLPGGMTRRMIVGVSPPTVPTPKASRKPPNCLGCRKVPVLRRNPARPGRSLKRLSRIAPVRPPRRVPQRRLLHPPQQRLIRPLQRRPLRPPHRTVPMTKVLPHMAAARLSCRIMTGIDEIRNMPCPLGKRENCHTVTSVIGAAIFIFLQE